MVLVRGSEAGDASDVEAEFGSSEYAKEILGQIWGFPPALELEKEAALQKAVIEMIGAGLVDSAKDCSEGGLAVTVAECGFARRVGAQVDLDSNGLIPEFVLFGEDASRVLISCDPQNVPRIQQDSGAIRPLRGSRLEVRSPINWKSGWTAEPPPRQASPSCRMHGPDALERALHVETEERLVPATLQKSSRQADGLARNVAC